jgi:hypothetical protein
MVTLVRGMDRGASLHSRSFEIEVGNFSPDLTVVAALVRAARTIADKDDGSWKDTTMVSGVLPQGKAWFHLEDQDEDLLTLALYVWLAAFLAGVLRRGKVTWEMRLPHLLPAAIQVILLTYWAIYWANVRNHAPSILIQIILAFGLDAAFSFARFGSWRIGASPLPIVLSSNLFAWFNPTGVALSLFAAFASKTLLRRKGRHILNPSAFGLALGGAAAAIAPEVVHFGGVFHTMNIAPNLAELVILLSVLPQLRFRIVPVSICAMLMLQLLGIPAILRPSMLLALTLLATDPATIPMTDGGKALFGAFLGCTMPATSLLLRHLHQPDDFSKVLPIPVANALVPVFDLVGGKVTALGARGLTWLRQQRTRRGMSWAALAWVKPVPNRALIAFWLLIVVPGLWPDKPKTFEPALHWTLGTPLVVHDADDVPRCPSNPVFCKPFSFLREAMLWKDRLRANGGAATAATVAGVPPQGG